MSAGLTVESGKSSGGGSKGGAGADDGMNDLYKINQIYYRMLPTLSLVAKRTLLVNQAQKTSYVGTNDTIVFNFNTGEYYISPSTSYLYIRCGYKDFTNYQNVKALISQGNALSLFEEVTFTTASGTEVERQLNKGLHHAQTYRYNHSQEYIDTIGEIQGAPTGKYSAIHDGVAPVRASYTTAYNLASMWPCLGGFDGLTLPRSGAAARDHYGVACANLNVGSFSASDASTGATAFGVSTALDYPSFCIPLNQILGVFKPYMNCLFPAGALSGGRLEIRLKNANESLQFVGAAPEIDSSNGTMSPTPGDPTNPHIGNRYLNSIVADCNTAFQVAQTYLVLDAFQLQDNVLKRLNQVAAGQDGLNLLFDTYDHVITNFQNTGSIECQVSQARSRVIRSFNVVRDTQAILNPYINSLASEGAIRRICGKVGPGSLTKTSRIPAVPTTTATTTTLPGPGGGLVYLTLLKENPVGSTTAPNAQRDDGFSGLLEEQPILPDDPYGPDLSYGRPIVNSFQTQLGSLFFPQQPITTPEEHYQNALYMWGKGIPDKDITCSASYQDFLGGLGAGWNSGTTSVNPCLSATFRTWVAPYGLAQYGCLAEKSQALQLSGLPIANARLMRHKFNFQYASASGSRTISTFTEFTRVMKVYLGGRVVVRE